MDSASTRGWSRKNRREKQRRKRSRRWVGHQSSLFLEMLESRFVPSTTAVISTSLPTVVNTAGSALSFNGANDYFITPNLQSSFPTTSVTVELWFEANAPGVILDELGTTTLNPAWHDSQIEILSSGKVEASVDGVTAVSLGTASFGEWNFVALRYNSSTSTLDGMLNGIAEFDDGDRHPLGPIQSRLWPVLRVRRHGLGEPGKRRLVQRDHGRYQHLERRPLECRDSGRHVSAPTTPQSGLVADYQLDQGAGSTAADSSGSNYTASLGGGTAANAPTWVVSNAPLDGVVSTGTATAQTAIDHFAVTFNQPLNTMAAGAANSYSLVGSSGDPTYSLAPSYTAGSTTVTFTMTPEPLQPGTYSFDTLSGLIDASGNEVTPLSLSFTISNPTDGQIASTSHQSLSVSGATPLPMTQVSPGFLTALGVGTFASTSDTNYWYLNANTGDHLTIRLEAQNPNSNSIYPQLYLENSAGTVIASAGGTASGIVELDNAAIPASGMYFVEVLQ